MATTEKRYQNPLTRHGVNLTQIAKSGLVSFLIHDCGYLPEGILWNHDNVLSPFWRLYHNPKAGNHVLFDGKKYPLTPDKLLIIPENVFFHCRGDVGTPHFWIHFSVTRHNVPGLNKPLWVDADETLRPAIKLALGLHKDQGSELGPQRLYHAAAALLHLSFTQLEAHLTEPYPERLQDLLALIHSAPHTELSNRFLAQRVGMSVENFIRWFRKHINETPASYVSRVRVRLASELLAVTDRSIEQIAEELGFPNRYYFTRVFGKQVGCGPAAFRQRHRAG